jgi:hypothetical protein
VAVQRRRRSWNPEIHKIDSFDSPKVQGEHLPRRVHDLNGTVLSVDLEVVLPVRILDRGVVSLQEPVVNGEAKLPAQTYVQRTVALAAWSVYFLRLMGSKYFTFSGKLVFGFRDKNKMVSVVLDWPFHPHPPPKDFYLIP